MSYAVEYKPDYDRCAQRIEAWFCNEIIDRVPIRFSAHNAQFSDFDKVKGWKNLRDMWFDGDYQLKCFEQSLNMSSFLGETFPVFCPNLGPNIYAAFLGANLSFSEVTSWAEPCILQGSTGQEIDFSTQNEYYEKIQELTNCALEKCKDKFYVGYTDLHAGLDCLDAMMGTQELLIAMLDDADSVSLLAKRVNSFFGMIYTDFTKKLSDARQPSVNWMNIPTREAMYVPSCDLSAMMSTTLFDKFAKEPIVQEMTFSKKNIFHLDGKDVARHLDSILQMDNIDAIQWVQGVGSDEEIMQWIPMIKKIQNAHKGILVDLKTFELEEFMQNVQPKGIYLCVDSTDKDEQQQVISLLEKWR